MLAPLAVVVALAGSCRDAPATRPAVVGKPAPVVAKTPAAVHRPAVEPPQGRALRVALYGDSIAWESRKPFLGMLSQAGVQVTLHTFPASAICDWFPLMRSDATRQTVDAVVLVFTGAWYTPCVRDPATNQPLGGTTLLNKSLADARTAITINTQAGIHVFLGLEPVPRRPMRSDPYALRAGLESLAATTPGVTLIPANLAVEGPAGEYLRTMPCASFEPCDGWDAAGQRVVVIRGPDGIHFCPVPHTGWDCQVWSSGAVRYGTALAGGILRAYGLRS